MRARLIRAIVMIVSCMAVAACGTAATATQPSAPPSAPALSFDGYQAAFCAGLTSMGRAVGNPDANTPSVLSKSLDDAMAARDVQAATSAAAATMSELEAGRQQATLAAGWEPGKASALALDRVLVVFEAVTKAKLAVATGTPGAVDPKQVLYDVGGPAAWSALVSSAGSIPVPSGASPQPCKAFSDGS